jgi:hypothetical protein
MTALAVYDGREKIGSIRTNGKRFIALDARGKELGSFDSQKEASRAVTQALIKQLECNVAWSEHRHEG